MDGYKSKCISHKECDIRTAGYRKRCLVGCCLFTLAALVLGGLCAVALFPLKVERARAKINRVAKEMVVRMSLPQAMSEAHPSLLTMNRYEAGCATPEFWIAHGGGIGEFVYSNCMEAVQDSLRRGFRYIELDIMTTSDGHLLGGHTWKELRFLAGADAVIEAPMSRSEIETLRTKWKKTLLFAEDICQLMQENPEMILVTDKIQDFELLAQKLPFKERMIVEAYTCYDALRALQNGFDNVALTTWSVHDLMNAQRYRFFGIVLYAPLIDESAEALALVQQLHQSGCCVMVHWASVCDKPDYVHRHLGKNISRIYTNTWSPSAPPPQP